MTHEVFPPHKHRRRRILFLFKNTCASVRAGYHYKLKPLPSGHGQGVYIGILAEGANAWASTREASLSDLRYAVTAVAGADTIIGPFFLGYGCTEGGRGRVYLTLGRTF